MKKETYVPLPHQMLLAISIAFLSGTVPVAGQIAPAPANSSTMPAPAITLQFCDGERNRDALFQTIEADQVCASSVLQNLVRDERERVSLALMASSYLAAVNGRRSKKLTLPLPLQVLGTMVIDTVQTNNEQRRGFNPGLPRPSSLAEPELSNDPEPVNWAAEGLLRAQTAGSCEAVTIGLFKRLSRNDALGPGQRLMAGRILRAVGIAAFHPDDRCLRMNTSVDPTSDPKTAR